MTRIVRRLRRSILTARLPRPVTRPMRLEALEARETPATVGGVVFYDFNGNGAQDPGEVGVKSPVIAVAITGGTVDTSTTTNASGQYSFTGIPDGTYTVRATVPVGFTATSLDPQTVTIAGGVDVTNADFALQPDGKITGVVFEDKNGNGVQDSGEPAVPGATVTGNAFGGTTADFTATTDASGKYTFTGVPDGTTAVTVTPPAGYASLPTSTADVTVSNAGTVTQDLGVAKPAVISGTVFQDFNGNGTQDAGETGLAGATVTLDAGTAAAVTTTTSPTGGFAFTTVPDGTHKVTVAAPTGYSATSAGSQTVAVAGGASVNGLTFALQPAGQISGVVYNDLNANGTQDAGESPVAGATVTLDRGADGTVESTVTTDATGKFTFTGVPNGPNTLAVTAPGFAPSTQTVTETGAAATTADVGLLKQAVVTGTVFNDVNGNGTLDAGEFGLGGVTVTLTEPDGTTTLTTTTDANGTYTFAGVPNGTSKVTVTAPAGNTVGTTNPQTVTVAGGATVAGENFAVTVTGQVTGVVFQDKNGNGVQDAGETGLAGVTVTLDEGATGTAVETATTDASGKYTFTHVPNGVSVVSALPAGYTATTTDPAVVTVTGGGTATENIGLAQPGVVSGTVFEDLNGNDKQDANEPGLAGVTVTLTQGTTTQTTTTDASGKYTFTGVPNGTGTVTATPPAGFTTVSATPDTVVVANGMTLSTQDIALRPTGQISGVVFNDLNGNGTQDSGEPALAGATVTVTEGPATFTTTTDANGKYTVTGVPNGTATVTAALAGYTSPTATVTVAGGAAATQNIALTQAGVVSGVVFNDANGNGKQDAGEAGLSGVTVTIDAGGSAPLTATTGSDGTFRFTGVPSGSHTLTVTPPSGYTATTAATVPFATAGGAAVTGLAVGLQSTAAATGQISGVVFNDANGNGTQDSGEAVLAGVTVTATPTAGGTALTATTDANGKYSFTGLAAGTYRLSATAAGGLAGSATVTVAGGGSVTQNLALTSTQSLVVTVFNDVNGNGVQDAGEAAVPAGTTVTLTAAGATTPALTATTNAAGQATFSGLTGLANGTYTIGVTGTGARVTTTQDTVTVTGGQVAPNQLQVGVQFRSTLTNVTAVGTDSPTGTPVVVYNASGQPVTPAGSLALNPAAGERVAVGDVNGDGVPDYAVGTAPGVATQVKVVDGKTGAVLFSVQPFESSFTGGVYVALGDLTGDGRADLIITPDQGGGPRVEVFDSGNGFAKIADFFGIADPNFRGGARAAVGDLNADGIGDLVVAAGFGGGPRIAAFDGRTIRTNQTPTRLFNDFFAFESTLRNGAFIAVGDLNGDGYGDIIAGGGPGGGPRVFAVSGKDLLTSGGATLTPLANFYAGGSDTGDRTGVTVAAKDLDGDGRADIIAGFTPTPGGTPVVAAYLGKNITPTGGTPPLDFEATPFAGVTGAVYVG